MHMYFLAVVLPGKMNEEIREYKIHMQERYECSVALRSPAHITLVPPFWMDEGLQPSLEKVMDDHFTTIDAFSLETDDFSAFKPRTIFIALKHNEHLTHLKTFSDEVFEQHPEFRIKKDDRRFHPHITIATRDLLKWHFREAWPYFEKKKYRQEWLADGVSLLRHDKKKWDVVHTSHFKKV